VFKPFDRIGARPPQVLHDDRDDPATYLIAVWKSSAGSARRAPGRAKTPRERGFH